jgi:hypothetical protein
VLVLVGQIQNHESLSRDAEHMNPNEVVEHPVCRRVLNALAFLVRKCSLMLLQDHADAVFEGCIDEQTHCHHHQQGHDAFGFFEIERGGQKLRVFEEAKPAFHLGLPFVSSEHRLGGQLALVQFVRREDKTARVVRIGGCRRLTQITKYQARIGHARGAAFSVSPRGFSLGWGLQGKVARTPHQSKGSEGTVCTPANALYLGELKRLDSARLALYR